MTWQIEFPDITDMPAIPEGFDDTSWHNDACPSFTSDALGLTVWVNYPKVEDRENGDAIRFILHRQRSGVEFGTWVLYSDHWQHILNAIEAKAICDKWVAVLGLGFHPDTKGRDYTPRLAPAQVRQYDSDIERLMGLGGDPYEYGIMAMEDWEARQNDQRHADMVAKQLDSQRYL